MDYPGQTNENSRMDMIVELLFLYVGTVIFGFVVGVLAGVVGHRVYDPVFEDVVYFVAAVLTAGFTIVMLEYGAPRGASCLPAAYRTNLAP